MRYLLYKHRNLWHVRMLLWLHSEEKRWQFNTWWC